MGQKLSVIILFYHTACATGLNKECFCKDLVYTFSVMLFNFRKSIFNLSNVFNSMLVKVHFFRERQLRT